MSRNADQEIEETAAALRAGMRTVRDVEAWYAGEQRRARLRALVALAIGLAVGFGLEWIRDGWMP